MHLFNFKSTSFDFLKLRSLAFFLSGGMIFLTLVSLGFRGLNCGIDFYGGTIMEVRFKEPIDFSQLRSKLFSCTTGEVSLQEFGNPCDALIKFEDSSDAESADRNSSLHTPLEATRLIQKIQSVLGPDVEYRRIDKIGPKVGMELIYSGIFSIICAFFAMFLYVWFRFELEISLASIVALIHDCLGIICLFTLCQIDFNETAIVAILITASYSINDTVVVFDRIRENKEKLPLMGLEEIINLSLNETLSRTILTSFTTLISLFTLYFFGGKIISSFSLPIIVGLSIGTYSSLFLATPTWLYLNKVKRRTSQIKNRTGE